MSSLAAPRAEQGVSFHGPKAHQTSSLYVLYARITFRLRAQVVPKIENWPVFDLAVCRRRASRNLVEDRPRPGILRTVCGSRPSRAFSIATVDETGCQRFLSRSNPLFGATDGSSCFSWLVKTPSGGCLLFIFRLYVFKLQPTVFSHHAAAARLSRHMSLACAHTVRNIPVFCL